jgi:uncharacterized protein with HEPN domain
VRRATEKIIEDLLDACDAAAVLVAHGREAYDEDRMMRLAGEAIIGRIGDASAKLHERADDLPSTVPWDDVIANRIVVDHAYHRIDDTAQWNTLERDVPILAEAVRTWALDHGLLPTSDVNHRLET